MKKRLEHTEDLLEAELPRVSLQKQIKKLKQKLISVLLFCAILLSILAIAVRFGIAWFVNNTVVNAQPATISAKYQEDYLLATRGSDSNGVYDKDFGVSISDRTEIIDGIPYTIASTNSSLFVNSQKHLNNLFDNADLRPGNRGTFDLYLICRNAELRNPVLYPVFSAWYEDQQTLQKNDAFSETSAPDYRTAAEYLKGHILLFASMDAQGLYSGYIDYTQPISLDLTNRIATQPDHSFAWGHPDYEDPSGLIVYRLPVYWVWPEQFSNFIYPKTLYDRNLFTEASSDRTLLITAMEDNVRYKQFFHLDDPNATRPDIDGILNSRDPNEGTRIYNLYSDWYDLADDQIGEYIAYIQFGFEIRPEYTMENNNET